MPNSIPAIEYTRDTAIRPTSPDDECPSTFTICLESMNISASTSGSTSHTNTPLTEPTPESAVTIKQCGHVFGRNCLTQWMNDSNTCPMCRIEFFVSTPEQTHECDTELVRNFGLGLHDAILGHIRELLVRDEEDEQAFEDLMERLQGRSADSEDGQAQEPLVQDWVRRYYA